MFQSLTGRLKTLVGVRKREAVFPFQSLTGRLKTLKRMLRAGKEDLVSIPHR